jgi:hypothetical protein
MHRCLFSFPSFLRWGKNLSFSHYLVIIFVAIFIPLFLPYPSLLNNSSQPPIHPAGRRVGELENGRMEKGMAAIVDCLLAAAEGRGKYTLLYFGWYSPIPAADGRLGPIHF